MSTKKPLLNESVVRRFLKLADVKPINEEWYTSIYEQEDEEPLPGEGEEDAALEPMELGEPEAEMPEDELADPVGDEPAADPMSEEGVEELVSAIADAIQSVTGVEVGVEGGEGGEELPAEEPEAGLEEPAELGAEAPMGDEGLPPEGGADLGAAEEEPANRGGGMYEGQLTDDVINEVTRRVAARLMKINR